MFDQKKFMPTDFSEQMDTSPHTNIYLLLSIRVDDEKFDEYVEAHGVPYHDYSRFDWDGLEAEVSGLIGEGLPSDRFETTLWRDVMCAPSKCVLKPEQSIHVYSQVISDLTDGTFDNEPARAVMLSPYQQSAPPAEIYFKFHLTDSTLGSEPEEGIQLLDNLAYHFFNGFGGDYVDLVQVIISNQHYDYLSLSPEMMELLCRRFDTPFTNDLSAIIFLNALSASQFT